MKYNVEFDQAFVGIIVTYLYSPKGARSTGAPIVVKFCTDLWISMYILICIYCVDGAWLWPSCLFSFNIEE